MAETLLIVQVESPQRRSEGDTVYRTVQPCRALGEQPGVAVLSGSWLAPEVRRLTLTADVLVLCMTAEPDHARAVPLLRRAVELAPESCAASYLLGARLLAAGEESGTAELRRCALLAPAFGAAQALLGERALATGDEAAGRRLLLEALDENPWLPTSAALLAQADLAAGRPEAALGALERALAADSRFWQTRYLTGRDLLAADRAADACPHLEAALERAENRAPVLEQLDRAQVALGHLDAARRSIEELKKITQPG